MTTLPKGGTEAHRFQVLTVEELEGFLNRGAPRCVVVTPTRNRVTLLSVEAASSREIRVRLHEAFLAAHPEILLTLKRYLHRRSARDWDRLSHFVQSIPVSAAPPPRPKTYRTAGQHVDLQKVYDRVNRQHFEEKVHSNVSWGRRPARCRNRRSIRYGSYDTAHDLIRIHPALDDPRVPQPFMDYIMFHEMLHAVIPPLRRNGRWIYHHEAYRCRERTFPDFTRMQTLSRELLGILNS